MFTLYFDLNFQTSKRSSDAWSGRNDCGTKVIIPNSQLQFGDELRYPRPGDYVAAEVGIFYRKTPVKKL